MDSVINTSLSINSRPLSGLSVSSPGSTPGLNPLVSAKTEVSSINPPLSQPQDTISLSGAPSSLGSHLDLDLSFKLPSIVWGTEKDDIVSVDRGENGSLSVTVNGNEKTYTEEEAKRLYFMLGEGDNVLTADPEVKHPLCVTAGDGNNVITGGVRR